MRILEVCVDSLASARGAIVGGADRLELCSALLAGGLTPYTALLRQIRAESDIQIRCLMRPRPGDFLYTPEELQLLRMQILQLKAAGACPVIAVDPIASRRELARWMLWAKISLPVPVSPTS